VTSGTQRVIFTAALTTIVGAMLVSTLSLGPIAGMAPLVVGVPTFALLWRELILDFRDARRVRARTLESSHGGAVLPADEWRMFAWVGLLLIGTLLLGLALGVSLFVLLFLRVRSGEPWRVACAFALAMWLVLAVVLERLLLISLYDGLIGTWIG
jgi:hypothetical protein